MKIFYEKYRHAIPLIVFALIYCSWFAWLEKTVTKPSNLIHMQLDDSIPFCEVFIVPYLLWFAYVSAVVLYLFFKDKQDYYRICTFLFTGMTIFLVISTLWPNGHHLRPHIMPRENIFTAMVSQLYRADTPTNLWPSIHVYNSLGAHFAVIGCRKLSKNRLIHISSLVLCISIIFSTVFLKQHSVFDVITAFILAAIMYITVYSADIVTVYQTHRAGARRRRVRQV